MKKTRRSVLWFLTLPQSLFAVCAIYYLFYRYSLGLLCILAASLAFNAFFTAYAFTQRKDNSPGLVLYIAMAAAYTAAAAAAMPLLEDTQISGFISVRLIAILSSAVPLVYSLFGLVSASKKGDTVRFLIGLILVPLMFFLGFNIANGINLSTAVMILIIAGVYTAVFLTVKIVLSRSKESIFSREKQKRRFSVLYAIFSIALPLTGLTLNASLDNLLGDFSDPVFYIVVVVNGILLLIPPFADRRLRLLKFFVTAGATLYFVYFFIVFLPFIPLGLAALIYIVGILLFAPAAALIMQIIYLIREWPQVTQAWDFKRVLIVFIAGLFLLPALVLTSFIGDRNNLYTALSYLDGYPGKQLQAVDSGRLRRAMDNAGSVYEFDAFVRGIEVDNNTPIISSIYSGIVLGGTVIPQEEMDGLGKVFFDQDEEASEGWETERHVSDAVITDISTETKYDEDAKAYRAWVDITLKGSANADKGEYRTLFYLPEGAYITNYYLDVSGVRKQGILADDRAATQIYEDIVRVKRDPGLLHYAGDRAVELRVFPFSGSETRRTGFEVIYGQQGSFIIDGRTVELNAPQERDEIRVGNAVLISAKLKETLPPLKLRPLKLYFIVDCSQNSDLGYQLSMIKDYAGMNGIDNAKVLFTSYRVIESDLKNAGSAEAQPECGFNLAFAVRKILSENGSDTVPVILFTSQNPYGAFFPGKITAIAKQYPETNCYYQLNDDMTLMPYSFESNEKSAPVSKPAAGRVLSYKGTPVIDDGLSELVRTGETTNLRLSGSQYEDAVSIDAAREDAEPLELIRASFRAHVLTRKTAFIVVETKAQEKELYDLQEAFLNNGASSARITLDEPPAVLCITAAALVIITIAAIKRLKRVKKI